MRRKVYIASLFLLLALPVWIVVLFNKLTPESSDFPSIVKFTFILASVFLLVLNQTIDYHKDNSPKIRFLYTLISFLPLVAISFTPIEQLIIDTSNIVWFIILLAIYSIFSNHTGVLAKNRSRGVENVSFILILISFVLSIVSVLSGNTLFFSSWLVSIFVVLIFSVTILFKKKRADLIE